MTEQEELEMVGYYLYVEGGGRFFYNRKRLWIAHQMPYLMLQAWCFEMNWVGT